MSEIADIVDESKKGLTVLLLGGSTSSAYETATKRSFARQAQLGGRLLAVRLARWPRTWLCGMRTVLGHATTAVQRAGSWMLKRHACPKTGMDAAWPDGDHAAAADTRQASTPNRQGRSAASQWCSPS